MTTNGSPFSVGEVGVLSLAGFGAKGGGSVSTRLGPSKGSGSSPGIVGGGGAGFLLVLGGKGGAPRLAVGMVGEVGDAPGRGSGGLRR